MNSRETWIHGLSLNIGERCKRSQNLKACRNHAARESGDPKRVGRERVAAFTYAASKSPIVQTWSVKPLSIAGVQRMLE